MKFSLIIEIKVTTLKIKNCPTIYKYMPCYNTEMKAILGDDLNENICRRNIQNIPDIATVNYYINSLGNLGC